MARVNHLSEAPLGTLDLPRKVKVYGAKWPGDEDWNQSLIYFKKYLKVGLYITASPNLC